MQGRWTIKGLALGAVALLTACGGGGGSEAPETLSAGADSATLTRGASALVQVLANDRGSRDGRPSLAAIVQAPAQGQAVIESGQIRYTPNGGFFGSDRLRYQARLDNGATAEAELSLTVEAPLRIAGVVTDGPIANASVELQVGERRYTATADANGRYQVDAVLRAPGEMLRLQANGAASQAQVRLSSLLGEAAELVRAAGSGSSVDDSQVAAARVTHLSTAQEALVLEANNGNSPTSRSALELALAKVDPMQMLQLAASIKLVVDGGVALPAGVSDTLSLVRSASAREAFIQQRPAELARVVNTVSADPGLGSADASPLPDGTSEHTAYYFFGRGGRGNWVLRVNYRSDGSATVQSSQFVGGRAMGWRLHEGEILLTPVSPIESVSIGERYVDGVLQPVTYTTRIHSLHLRPLGGTRLNGLAQFTTTSELLIDGVQTNPPSRGSAYLFQQRAAQALALPLTAAQFAPGSVWAGLGFFPVGGNSPWEPFMQDLVEFSANGQARQRITGEVLQWSVTDGLLQLQHPDGRRLRYRALQDLGDGEQRWWAESLPAQDGATQVSELLVVKQDPALVFSMSSLSGLWRSQINLLAQLDRFYLRLRDDGQASHITARFAPVAGNPAVTESSFGSWSVADGRMLTQSAVVIPDWLNLREWTPLARKDGKLMVLEWRVIGDGVQVDRSSPQWLDAYRTNVYTLESTAW